MATEPSKPATERKNTGSPTATERTQDFTSNPTLDTLGGHEPEKDEERAEDERINRKREKTQYNDYLAQKQPSTDKDDPEVAAVTAPLIAMIKQKQKEGLDIDDAVDAVRRVTPNYPAEMILIEEEMGATPWDERSQKARDKAVDTVRDNFERENRETQERDEERRAKQAEGHKQPAEVTKAKQPSPTGQR